MKDYYAILGVPPSASQAEIKRAFRKLAVRYHPDKNRSPDAKGLFQEINEAYDTLGDPDKRSLYDARRENPFAGIVVEPVSRHRDPAYRRRAYRPPRKHEPPASYVLMRDYLKYVIWISRIGLLFSTIFFLDYFLPYRQAEEHVVEIVEVGSDRKMSAYLITTQEGSRMRVYDFDPWGFGHNGVIRVVRTTVYRTVMSIANASGTYILKVGYMYRSLLWLPIILFVNSLLALLQRKRVEWCFNLNITCLMWLIMSFILL